MSTRRSTRERKKPKPIYEVEDRRPDNDDDADRPDGDADGQEEDGEDFEQESGDDGEDDKPRAIQGRKRAQQKPAGARGQRRAPAKRRKLKPVQEEPETAGEDGDNAVRDIEGGDDANDEEDTEFFEAVKRGNCSMSDLVIEWRERFEEDNEAAAREVLNFVLQACGGQGQCVPSSEPLEKLDMSDLVDYVVGDLEQSGEGYPLASRQRAYKKFYLNFVDFWDAFVKECYESELLFSTEIVRLESIRTLGTWIMGLPEQFLKDNYMKYLGWVLNDKDASNF
ncbi:hypothetical protein ATCC90586_005928 [Pythium insidiosum]|nr:hypothetical protein ATCC90586_005928 [Pythium insidiosum]